MSTGSRSRAALVTGGGRGLGRAIAERLAKDGARVGVLARTADEVESSAAAVRQTGGEALALVADVLDRPSLKRAMGRFQEWAGGFDTLVCAAGQLKAIGPLVQVDADAWWRDLETSVRGVLNSLREAIVYLRRSDAASVSILVGHGLNTALPYATGYASGQSALARLVESVAEEWVAEGIRVYAVNPGLVVTNLVRPLFESPEGRRWLPRFNEALAEGKELGPAFVADTVAWLAENRPPELNGRIVPAAQTPTILETRLARIREEDLHRLRLR
jgi:NAD(P)-dependent dehydrogenase (short-subunit alcohol dehydrogenase family)